MFFAWLRFKTSDRAFDNSDRYMKSENMKKIYTAREAKWRIK